MDRTRHINIDYLGRSSEIVDIVIAARLLLWPDRYCQRPIKKSLKNVYYAGGKGRE